MRSTVRFVIDTIWRLPVESAVGVIVDAGAGSGARVVGDAGVKGRTLAPCPSTNATIARRAKRGSMQRRTTQAVLSTKGA